MALRIGKVITEMDKVRAVVIHCLAEGVPIIKKGDKVAACFRLIRETDNLADLSVLPFCGRKKHAADAIDPRWMHVSASSGVWIS